MGTHRLSTPAIINGKEIFELLRGDLSAIEREFGRDTVSGVEAITEIGEYLRSGGGKRIRPMLLLLSSKLLDYRGRGAIKLGAVVEIIHTATLVHDDIIDEAQTRRGRPAANTQWGNSKCVLAGDWLYMQAFKIAVQERNFRILDTLIDLGSDCRLKSYSVIIGCELGDDVLVQNGCVLEHSRIGAGASLGPFSHLRPGNDVGPEAHIGNFVELKKTKMGRGSKANHLTYLGDSIIGEKVNVGAGTITCNYDGVRKHTTVIEDGAFIGSDSTLVAPVKIGRNAYVGAAACITEDVPEDALAIARSRQVNKEGWVKAKREEMAQKNTSS